VEVNVHALRRIAGWIAGYPQAGVRAKLSEHVSWRARVDAVPIKSVTPQKVEEFRNHHIKSAGADEERKARA
jgi:hypothetical protein